MRRLSTTVLATLFFLVGCKDDGVRASDYDGLWLISSITFSTDDGTITLERDGTPQGFRGDAVFTAIDADDATLDVRQVALQDGLIVGEIMTPSPMLRVEEGRWILTEDADVQVFTIEEDGDHIVMTVDEADPRHTDSDAPLEVVVDRVEPWSTSLVGEWELVSMTLPTGTVSAGECVEVQTDLWATLEMEISIDDRQLFERLLVLTLFDDAACTSQATRQETLQWGYGEEEDGTTLRMWAVEEGESEYQGFSIAASGDEVTLTLTECLPLPACEESAPSEVVVQRAP